MHEAELVSHRRSLVANQERKIQIITNHIFPPFLQPIKNPGNWLLYGLVHWFVGFKIFLSTSTNEMTDFWTLHWLVLKTKVETES